MSIGGWRKCARFCLGRVDDGKGGLRDVRIADDRRLLVRLTDETVLKGVNTLPLFAGLAGLAVRLLAMSTTWWREGR
ncbi:MAG: hypothetical protein H5U22_14120 [Rhizobium sp.]|nr:hypothetical protein [Rhizobium sp.]